jgi:hypothetical protein
LTRHLARCRTDDGNRVIVKGRDNYPCDICHQKFDAIKDFKRHIFHRHSDIESRAKYNRSIEKLVGAYMMKRLRDPVMNRIREGKFLRYTEEMLSLNEPFKSRDIRRDF